MSLKLLSCSVEFLQASVSVIQADFILCFISPAILFVSKWKYSFSLVLDF